MDTQNYDGANTAGMDVIERLQSAITMVEEARSVPLSASCVVHRGELLEVLDYAKVALPHGTMTVCARGNTLVSMMSITLVIAAIGVQYSGNPPSVRKSRGGSWTS